MSIVIYFLLLILYIDGCEMMLFVSCGFFYSILLVVVLNVYRWLLSELLNVRLFVVVVMLLFYGFFD